MRGKSFFLNAVWPIGEDKLNVIGNKKIFIFLGLMYVGLGVFSNEAVLGYYFSSDGKIESWLMRSLVFLCNFLLIGWGLIVMTQAGRRCVVTINLAILGAFLLGSFLYMGNKVLRRVVFANNHFQLMGTMISRVDTDQNFVALTYDDGPNEEFTPELLEVLERNNVKATFFLVGNKIEKNLSLTRLMLEKGHELGNHTYDHKILVFKAPSYIRSQITKTNELLRQVGVDGEIYFRAPYGEKFIVLPYILDQMDMKNILFDVEPQDWRGLESERVVDDILKNTKPGSIILLHDGIERSGSKVAQTTERVIQELKRKGYRFKTVSELLKLSKERI